MSRGEEVTLRGCLVSLLEDVQLSAAENGLLAAVNVKEGSEVKAGALLAQIDDREPQLRKQAANLELKAARERATNKADLDYAEAEYALAKAEYDHAVYLNQKKAGTITRADLRRRKLAMVQAYTNIEKVKQQQRVALLSADVNIERVKAAENEIARRKVTSPLKGIVIAVYRKPGEYVQRGDVVARVVQMDRLRVEGFVQLTDYNASEIAGRPVTVVVELARGEKAAFDGEIVFVDPLVKAGGKYRVRAEVDNRQIGRQWLLRPGMTAEMKIRLGP